MGVSWHHVKALVSAHKAGVNFGRTLTVGRLNLFISPRELKELLAGSAGLIERYDQFFKEYPTYAEPLFYLLGAQQVSSIDASDYEKATYVHDMNTPIPDHLKGQFDLVDDGGTLEHVFNFPTALRNCMQMVKVGGHLMLNVPANNFLGHGFYQFSPELFFRALSEPNGYTVERLVTFKGYDYGQWYEVSDPRAVRSRVELISDRHRIGMWVRARRVADVPIFEKMPQQSDYVDISWQRPRDQQESNGKPAAAGAAANGAKPNPFLAEPNRIWDSSKRTFAKLTPALFNWLRYRRVCKKNMRFAFERQTKFYKPVDD
jgi:hypothetical protein